MNRAAYTLPTKRADRLSAHALRAAVLAMAAVAASACAAHRLDLPEGAGEPFPGYQAAFDAASASCRDVRTLTTEASVSGTVGRTKVRGRVIAGFERPGRMRLEGVAPVGPPAFILAAAAGTSTLLMPRAAEFLANAPPQAVLEALVGVSVGPDDLQAVLAGCVSSAPVPADGRRYPNGWVRIDLGGGSTVYLRQQAGAWRIVAGLRPLFAVEYEFSSDGERSPRVVRLRATADGGPGANLRLVLGQVEVNAPIDAKAFTVAVPSSALPITLSDLKQSGPLGAGR